MDGAVRVDFNLQQHHFLDFTCASFPTSKSLSSANVFRGGESCLQISHLLGQIAHQSSAMSQPFAPFPFNRGKHMAGVRGNGLWTLFTFENVEQKGGVGGVDHKIKRK